MEKAAFDHYKGMNQSVPSRLTFTALKVRTKPLIANILNKYTKRKEC